MASAHVGNPPSQLVPLVASFTTAPSRNRSLLIPSCKVNRNPGRYPVSSPEAGSPEAFRPIDLRNAHLSQLYSLFLCASISRHIIQNTNGRALTRGGCSRYHMSVRGCCSASPSAQQMPGRILYGDKTSQVHSGASLLYPAMAKWSLSARMGQGARAASGRSMRRRKRCCGTSAPTSP